MIILKNHNRDKKNKLSTEKQKPTLKSRFEKNMNHHKSIEWSKVEEKNLANASALWSIRQMEATEGEPDFVSYDKKSDEYLFFDCGRGYGNFTSH